MLTQPTETQIKNIHTYIYLLIYSIEKVLGGGGRDQKGKGIGADYRTCRSRDGVKRTPGQ